MQSLEVPSRLNHVENERTVPNKKKKDKILEALNGPGCVWKRTQLKFYVEDLLPELKKKK